MGVCKHPALSFLHTILPGMQKVKPPVPGGVAGMALPVRLFQKVFQDFTGTAFLHLFRKRASLGAVTAGSADEPAQMSALKLPGRALLLHPAVFSFPAWDSALNFTFAITEKEEDLTFNMGRNRSPPLFIAVNGLECDSEQFRHLFLCFSKLFPGSCKFLGIQLDLLVHQNSLYGKDTTDVHI